MESQVTQELLLNLLDALAQPTPGYRNVRPVTKIPT